jgi:hypothetical protein
MWLFRGSKAWLQWGVVHHSYVLLVCRKFWFLSLDSIRVLKVGYFCDVEVISDRVFVEHFVCLVRQPDATWVYHNTLEHCPVWLRADH